MMNRTGNGNVLVCGKTGGLSPVARRFSWWPKRRLRSDRKDGPPGRSDHGSDGSIMVL